jgi:hypothetical protein
MDRLIARLSLLAACAALAIGPALAAEMPRIQGESAWAQEKSAPAKLLLDKATSAVDTATLPALDSSLIADAQRANRSASVKAMKVGVNRALTEGAVAWAPDLQWQWVGGKRAAQLRIASPDAAALRVALSFRHLPENIELRVTGRDGEAVIGPLFAADLRAQIDVEGRYWSPVTEGDAQWLEIALPAGAEIVDLGLAVEGVSHLFTSISDRFKLAKGIGDSASCEVDLACVPNPSAALLNAARSVAKMVFTSVGGSFLCTGTLLNDADAGSQVPYFMTANHCISKQAEAGTINTYWFYDAVSCSSPRNLTTPLYTQLAAGATLLVNRPELDSTLLRLLNVAPSGSFFTGYDANAFGTGTGITIVHHPLGDLKKVSQGQVIGFSAEGELPNLSGGFTVVGYTAATTEGGSSGSALLTLASNQYLLRGTLYGGPAACSNSGDLSPTSNNYDYYSRFDEFYPFVKAYVGPITITPSVEFYNSTLNHYFMTSESGEMAFVDNGGAGPGWGRTGFTFNVFTAINSAYPTSNPACRFYGPGPNSHFYTTDTGECNLVKAGPGWLYEGLNFVAVNPSAGNCAAGTSPVYRAYNNRYAQNDSNHRFSTSRATLEGMTIFGWVVEGVVFCAPN